MTASASLNSALVAARTHMLEALALIVTEPGQVVELGIPEAKINPYGNFRCLVSGYFTDMAALADSALAYIDAAEGIYITCNPVSPVLLARAENRVVEKAKHRTADEDIVCRRWIFVDIDPERPAGVCATDAERALAMERQATIRSTLASEGWPEPLSCSSGSGAYLLYRVDLPADDNRMTERCLKALAARFDDESVRIDPTTYNPARIMRLPGTRNRKGDDSPTTGRRHRFAEMDPVPTASPEPVPVTLIEELIEEWCPADSAPTQYGAAVYRLPVGGVGKNGAASGPTISPGSAFDIDSWLVKQAVPVAPPKPYGKGGRRWLFNGRCPWTETHKGREVHIVQMASGALSAGCQHRSCPGSKHTGNKWHELRAIFEPGWQPRQAEYIPPAGSSTETAPKSPVRFELNDIGNGKRLIHWHGENLRFMHEWKRWLFWDGARWDVDNTAEVYRMAKDARRAIYAEMNLVTGESKEDEATRQAISKHAAISASARAIEAMVKLATSEQGVPVLVKQLDADPWLFTCANGMLDLRTGELRKHCRSDYATKMTSTVYSPVAQAPTFIGFLRRITGWKRDEKQSAQLMEFLQRAVGYSLTGDTSERALFFCYGRGRNGKTTLIELLLDLLGDYGQQADFKTFIEQKNESVRNDLAALRGARFVSAVETKAGGAKFDEGTIKKLTGRDTITTRFLYQEQFSFRPEFKLWLAANHRPRSHDTTDSFWDRMREIPFGERIPKSEEDLELPKKLRVELSGVLRWAVDGCLAWQKHGLGYPEAVETATSRYRAEMDPVGRFLAACCLLEREASITKSQLYSDYEAYCRAGADEPLSHRVFSEKVDEKLVVQHGNDWITERKSGSTRFWKGIRAKTQIETELESRRH